MDVASGIQADQDQLAPQSQAMPPILDEVARPYVGRWQQLVSTTNWEKGRIISEWRRAAMASGNADESRTDEVWSQMVGSVTPQHVGRLRRVFDRFGATCSDYEGLYWSHFHAAIEWDDAEMWLEGAVQNDWSVAQLRRQRSETLGHVVASLTDGAEPPAPWDEDFDMDANGNPMAEASGVHELPEAVYDAGSHASTAHAGADSGSDVADTDDTDDGAVIYAPPSDQSVVPFVRPFAQLADLPDDLSDAFERFKLAILRHKGAEWAEISREDVLASLDALKELALAPARS